MSSLDNEEGASVNDDKDEVNEVTLIYSHKFDLLAIFNMDYWNLKVEIRKFNDCQPKANRIKLNQSHKVS